MRCHELKPHNDTGLGFGNEAQGSCNAESCWQGRMQEHAL